jgi:hypothetical protein
VAKEVKSMFSGSASVIDESSSRRVFVSR